MRQEAEELEALKMRQEEEELEALKMRQEEAVLKMSKALAALVLQQQPRIEGCACHCLSLAASTADCQCLD